MVFNSILDNVGNTPLISIGLEDFPSVKLFSKLEYLNPTGSVKDRAASYILKTCLERGIINQKTTIVESSSGNFGVALSAYCRKHGLKFICVVDPNILPVNRMLIQAFGGEIDEVQEPDSNGGYLLTRIARVNEWLGKLDNIYWVNQYGNKLNADAYYHSLGNEIYNEFPDELDYLFLGISSGGTITGISRKMKEKYPNIKIIAVDIYGSVIFGHPSSKRHIPGIGSSMRPDILKDAFIDDVVMISEVETIRHCHALLQEQNVFVGGSSGSVYAGVKKYFAKNPINGMSVNAMCIFPDRGERYTSTIYDKEWAHGFIKGHEVEDIYV